MNFLSLFSGLGALDLACERAGLTCVGQVELDKTCLRVLKHHWPSVKRRTDVKTTKGRRGRYGLLAGGFPCFSGDTLILAKRGLVPIRDMKVGDLVYTHKNRWRRVTSVMSRVAEETLILSGGFHNSLVTTDEHPFWASKGRKRKYKRFSERRRGNWYDTVFSPPEWVEAKDIKGRYWSSPILGDGDDPPQDTPFVSPEFFWVVGYWVGDGWFRKDKEKLTGIVLCCPKDETEELGNRLCAAGMNYCKDGSDPSTDKLIVSNAFLSRWLREYFGEYSDGKKIPSWLLTCRKDLKESFLQGYVWADGCDRRYGWKATTVCHPLAVGVALLGRSVGYHCTIYKNVTPPECVIQGRVCSQQPWYEVRGSRFQKQTSAFVLDNQVFAKCRKVERGGPQEVFNISVEEDESYTAGGILCHNCQDLSVAGKRAGLAGDRSGLFFQFARVAQEAAVRWLLVENVPGLLSSNGGRDMGTLLGCLGQLGYGWAYRVLDAQYCGVPQRRRRVFVVGCLGDAARAAKVLFEEESLYRDSPPRREAGQEVAGSLGGGSGERGWCDDLDRSGAFVPEVANSCRTQNRRIGQGWNETMIVDQTAATLRSRNHAKGVSAPGRGGEDDQNLIVFNVQATYAEGKGPHAQESGITKCLDSHGGNPDSQQGGTLIMSATGSGTWRRDSPTLAASDDNGTNHVVVEAYQCHGSNVGPMGTLRQGNGNTAGGVPFTVEAFDWTQAGNPAEVCPSLRVGSGLEIPSSPAVRQGMVVRRLTPLECLRLQGLPDDWLDLDPELSDSAKYRMIGNAVCVNVVEWIARRILDADS